MPNELKKVAHAAQLERDYRRNRDLAIIVAHQEGHSLREIAEAAGLSHAGVKKIVERG